jgi:hypothetical protein
MGEEHLACLKQEEWGKLWEIIKLHSAHVMEGDKSGGFRDRLLMVERDMVELKRRFWLSSILGGVIGALIGSGSNDVVVMLIKWIMGK